MTGSRLLVGLASVFAAIAVVMFVTASAYRTPVPLAIALPTGLTGYLLWYQGTGRLARRMGERTRQPEGRTRTGSRSRNRGRRTRRGRSRTQRSTRGSGQTRREAYNTLDLDPGSEKSEIKRAYRKKVKTTHPDRGGDEEAFKEVTDAYERLT